jgi:hypothetical protein
MVTATEISTHGAYVLAASISLFFMARWLQSQELRYGYGAVIALAVACTASEYAPLVLLTLIACMALHRRTLFHGWSRARFRNALGWSAVLFVATIFVVWPGALLKQTLVKNYLFMGYLALGRQGEFGTEGFAHVWGHRLSNAPVEYAVVVLATLAAFSLLKKHGWILPFLIYAGLMLAATVRITTSAERYISSLLPPLHIVSAVVIWHYARRLAPAWRAAVTGLILMAFVLQAVSHARTIRARSSETRQEDHVVSYFLMDRTSGDEHILTTSEFLPTLHYYFPTRTFQSYSDEGDMIATLRRSSFNGVITKGRDQSLLERELAKHFVVQRETITSASTPEESVVYFRILRRTPESL